MLVVLLFGSRVALIHTVGRERQNLLNKDLECNIYEAGVHKSFARKGKVYKHQTDIFDLVELKAGSKIMIGY